MSLMIQGVTSLLHKKDNGKYDDIDIVIDGSEIIAIGKDIDHKAFGVETIIPARNKLVIPGLINAHLHSHDRFDKGRFDKLPLEVWMAMYNPPTADRKWTARECYLRTVLSGIELIKSGTTTVIDDFHPGFPLSYDCLDAVFQAYKDIGLRAQVSIAFSDKPYFKTIPFLEEILPPHLKQTTNLSESKIQDTVIELWRDFASRWHKRVQFILSPSGPQRCSDSFLKKVWGLSEELELPVVVHVLETKVQEFTGRQFYGKSVVEQLEVLGLLTPLTSLVHCVWVNNHDIEVIAKAGSSVIHNPLSNLKLGSGIAPIHKMMDAGINIGLGTDNHNASDTPNMFEAMKLAALLHRSADIDYTAWIGAKDVFQMATQGGARCGNLNCTGVLEVGMKADLVLIDLERLSFFPQNDLIHQLVYCEHGDSVNTVIIDGKIVMQNRHISAIDEHKIRKELVDQVDDIMFKISQTETKGQELEPYLRRAYFRCLKEQGDSENLVPERRSNSC
jgi:guanine deaminase